MLGKTTRTLLSTSLLLWVGVCGAQNSQSHLPRGQVTVVSAADFQAVIDTLGEDQKNIDQVVHTTATESSAGNISVAAVAYHAGPQNWDGTANEHNTLTEVFYVTKGSATFVLDGNLENAKTFDPNAEYIRKVYGPGRSGKLVGYRTVHASVGDTLILPPNTPHNIIKVTEDFQMLVIRIDPERVLELGESD